MEDYRTTGTCAGDSTTQDEDEETAPVALPPPGSLDGAFFLALFSLRRFLSPYYFYTLIQNFLSFVVFHLRGEGVLLGDGVNGAEDDGLITESKFVFLLRLKHTNRLDRTVTHGERFITRAS